MSFYDAEHKSKISMFNSIWHSLYGVEELALSYGINDISQDNSLKLLQTLIIFDMQNAPGREGPDAIDHMSHYWELKSLNVNITKSFSTNHHLNLTILDAFRNIRWLFSVYQGIRMKEAYVMSPRQLEPLFSKWESKLNDNGNKPLNNPKINLSFVKEHGTQVYPFPETGDPLDPAEILKEI